MIFPFGDHFREYLQDEVAPLLDPDEDIEAVAFARSGPNPLWDLVTFGKPLLATRWAIAVTTRRVVLFRVVAPATVRGVAGEFPRSIPLVPGEGREWHMLRLGERRYWVKSTFVRELRGANQAFLG